MAQFGGKNYSREELLERVGRMSQLGEVTRFQFSEGKAKGLEGISFRTGSGLDFTVLPGRGMDLGLATYKGLPLSWISPVGYAGSEHYEAAGLGWLRTFGGGLLATCGLTWAGDPCVDQGEELGLHGRVAHIPAENVSTGTRWQGDDYYLYASGEMREASCFGPNVLLRRTIAAKLGEAKIIIEDEVENQGFETVPHMLVYHINLGFPLISENSKLILPAHTTRPRDPVAEANPDYLAFQKPSGDYEARVYYHQVDTTLEKATVTIEGEELSLDLTYSPKALPRLLQWKLFGQGSYVMGIEPANCYVDGRDKERAGGNLIYLEPGEKKSYQLEFALR